MDWQALVKSAAPLVGSLLGTPAMGAAIGMIANALGSDADPEAIAKAMASDPEAMHKLRKLELEHEASLKRMVLEAETARLGEVNRTMRAEAASNDAYVRRWRPTFGYLTAIAWAIQCVLIGWSIVWEPENAGQVAQAIAALTPMWGVALAMLGVNVAKRSHDKQVAAGQRPPDGFLGAIATRISGQAPR